MPLVLRLLPMMLGSALLAFAQPVISPAVSTLPDGRVGSLYSYAFSASGGTAPYSFTLSTGTLPSAMGLSTSGLLSGTPGSTFTGALRVQVRDAAGLTSERTVSLRILDSLSIATVSVDDPWSHFFAVSFGAGRQLGRWCVERHVEYRRWGAAAGHHHHESIAKLRPGRQSRWRAVGHSHGGGHLCIYAAGG